MFNLLVVTDENKEEANLQIVLPAFCGARGGGRSGDEQITLQGPPGTSKDWRVRCSSPISRLAVVL